MNQERSPFLTIVREEVRASSVKRFEERIFHNQPQAFCLVTEAFDRTTI